MKTFKEYFESEEARETIALLPGGFKPPTKGHYNAFKYLLQDADKGIIFIGNKERDGITAEQSKRIWEVYAKYLGKQVEVDIADVTPVRSVYEFADNNKDVNVIVGAGDKDEDVKRYSYFDKNVDKYPFVVVTKIPIQSEGISGTKTRELIGSNIDEALNYFTPEDINETDKEVIKSILLNK
tara:strand:- start:362 stop:907 length:546 start_codon:yes stop_codon:yes gene_type:complete